MYKKYIYGKNKTTNSLTDYQKAINKAAGQLAVANPQLLGKYYL